MKALRKHWLLAPAMILLLAAAAVWRAQVMQPRAARPQFQPPPEDMPPALIFTTVALGGFRGIMVDLLWMRAIHLQEESRVLELVQLSDWITALEPQFTTVWAFHAWNMAYNVSIMFTDPEDRWRWVRHGIRLLRDRALVFNPRHPVLLRELGWIYQHKIGYVMDSAHRHYKIRLAEEMTALLGGAHPDYATIEVSAAGERAREVYKLDSAIMAALDRDYGPLDWRLPATHALYWSSQGRSGDAGQAGVRACYQMFYQCMDESFRHGRLQFNPAAGQYLATPALELLPRAVRAHEEALQRFDIPSFHMAYANFLAEAAVVLYCYGELTRARDLYATLTARYPNPQGDPEFETFAESCLAGDLSETPREDAIALVDGFLAQSLFREARGDAAGAAEAAGMARKIWHKFMQSRISEDHRQRTGLPPLEEMEGAVRRRAAQASPADGGNAAGGNPPRTL